jgi:S1-C subfamily serine protease
VVGGLCLALFLVLAPPPAGAADPQARAFAQRMQQVFVEVAERLKPSVVNINTTQKIQAGRRQGEPSFVSSTSRGNLSGGTWAPASSWTREATS